MAGHTQSHRGGAGCWQWRTDVTICHQGATPRWPWQPPRTRTALRHAPSVCPRHHSNRILDPVGWEVDVLWPWRTQIRSNSFADFTTKSTSVQSKWFHGVWTMCTPSSTRFLESAALGSQSIQTSCTTCRVTMYNTRDVGSNRSHLAMHAGDAA